MQFRNVAGIVLLCAAMAGCARERLVEVRQTTVEPAIALSLRAANANVRFTFPKGSQTIEPGQFRQDELCYLKAGDFRIDCFTDGSALNFGPTDSSELLTDNPMWGIEPADGEKLATEAMRIYGILFLVAGSVDRLPGTLADYLQTPGQHLNEALSLTDLLLNQKRLQFQGHARGGNFVVNVELTDSGRDKLTDALDQMGESTAGTQWVRLSSVSHSLHPRYSLKTQQTSNSGQPTGSCSYLTDSTGRRLPPAHRR